MIALLLSSLLTLVQLNCENLFDTRHDSLKNDVEFTPEGEYGWTMSRYYSHLNNTARTILACAEADSTLLLPDLVALCEVENDSVMTDLTRHSMLRSVGYDYVMTSSTDPRGIDVALLYSTFTVELLSWHPVSIASEQGQRPTRDLLYAKILFLCTDTVHVVVLHAPSRRGGQKHADRNRRRVISAVESTVDSITRHDGTAARILIAGDFNDYAASPLLTGLADRGFQNVTASARGFNGVTATYVFRRHWGSLDHIFASGEMSKSLVESHIGDFPFLIDNAEEPSRRRPRRSFLGSHYQYGFSDHLPLIVRFRMSGGL